MGDCTTHFNFSEFAVSSEEPTLAALIKITEIDKIKIRYLCQTILEPVREHVGAPLYITSGKRSPALLMALKEKGYPVSLTTDHLFMFESCCCDIQIPSNPELLDKAFSFIREKLTHAFGELIAYFRAGGTWKHLHVGLPTRKDHGQILVKTDGKGIERYMLS